MTTLQLIKALQQEIDNLTMLWEEVEAKCEADGLNKTA